MSEILVPVSPGELLDKIAILRLKSARMIDAAKLANVRRELGLLEDIWRKVVVAAVDLASEARALAVTVDLAVEERALAAVNAKLWDVEDRLRDLERAQRFDAEFVELAREVYFANDERAMIKKRVNLVLGSDLVEEKSYTSYR